MNNKTKAILITVGIMLGIISGITIFVLYPIETFMVVIGFIFGYFMKIIGVAVYEDIKDRLDNVSHMKYKRHDRHRIF